MPSPISRPRLSLAPRPGTPAGRTAAGTRRLDLDVVRGIAIVLAMGWHFNQNPSGNAVVDALQWPGATFGWAGVDLFFVLSGFLVGRLVLREHQRTGRFDAWRFSVRRALKLWPVLYVFLAVYTLVGLRPWQTYFWQNALHVQNYVGTSLQHLWSLAVEEHFYLALVILFPLLTRRRVAPKVLVGVLAGLLVTALALRGYAVITGVGETWIQWRTHYRMDSLAAGVLLATLSVYWPGMFDRMLRLRWLWAGLTAAGVYWLAKVGNSGPLGDTLGYTIAYLTAAAFLLTLYRAAWVPRTGWLAQGVAAMGRYSYGIYIWHLLASQLLGIGLTAMHVGTSTPAAQLAKYVSAVTLGIVATLIVERPVLRLRDRLIPQAPRPARVPPPAEGDAHATPPEQVPAGAVA
jgi:peptidoglycan/LPS O-acetylase OafA/YrhL